MAYIMVIAYRVLPPPSSLSHCRWGVQNRSRQPVHTNSATAANSLQCIHLAFHLVETGSKHANHTPQLAVVFFQLMDVMSRVSQLALPQLRSTRSCGGLGEGPSLTSIRAAFFSSIPGERGEVRSPEKE